MQAATQTAAELQHLELLTALQLSIAQVERLQVLKPCQLYGGCTAITEVESLKASHVAPPKLPVRHTRSYQASSLAQFPALQSPASCRTAIYTPLSLC